MKNKEELEKKTGVKRFDICLMNPPYIGKNPGDSIYIDFINNCFEISDKLVLNRLSAFDLFSLKYIFVILLCFFKRLYFFNSV